MMLYRGGKSPQTFLKIYRMLQLLFMSSLLIVLMCVSEALLHAETPTVKGMVNSLLGPDDKTPPEIELFALSDGQTVYTDKIYIAGQAFDNDRIKTLTINKVQFISKLEKSVLFSYLAELKEGQNIISIEAGDDGGNKTKKDIVVTREDPQLSKLSGEVLERRMRLALYPFEQQGAVSAESSMFLDMLTLALQREARFQLTDRVLMDRILNEQRLSLTQVVSQDAAVKAGRLMSAQAVVTGSIIRTEEGFELMGRMIDTETSGIMVTEKIHSAKEGAAGLNFLAQALAVRLHNDFPMLGGIVVNRQGSNIFTSLGQGSVTMNGKLIIYRESASPSGSTSGTDSMILGYARITQVSKDMSKAELLGGSPDKIRVLDKVIVQ